jgi:3',5'-cyclic-AMP phosphodiesterase
MYGSTHAQQWPQIMPIHLTSRRQFIAQLGAAVTLSHSQAMAADVDESLIAILNDTHIAEKHPANSPMPTHLRETVANLVGLQKRPATVVINGDLALNNGQAGDYTHFAKLIAPLREAGIPVHLTMGNHDDRSVFYDVLKSEKQADAPVASKHVGLVQTAKANLFLLDSLKAPNVAQGLLGDEQLSWLAKLLDAHNDKPALIFAHHNPRLDGEEIHFQRGLEDSAPLWHLLTARSQVKAYIHGHIHHRNHSQHRKIHILNTPATSFVANPTQSTTGWTMLRLGETGAVATTHTHLPNHPWNGATTELRWRA